MNENPAAMLGRQFKVVDIAQHQNHGCDPTRATGVSSGRWKKANATALPQWRSWLRGADLFPSRILIPLQLAESTIAWKRSATKVSSSFSFHSASGFVVPNEFLLGPAFAPFA
jgi:hypothetical protein